MKNSIYTTCDACNEIIDGVDKVAKVQKRYLTIQGSISLTYWDEHGVPHFCYAVEGPNAKYTFLHFCDGFCLDDFMEVRLMMKAKYHEENNLPLIKTAKKIT